MKPELLSGIIISLIALLTMIIALWGAKKILGKDPVWKKLLFAAILWTIGIGLISSTGILATMSLPPKPMITMLIALASIIAFSFSQTGKKLLTQSPLHWLVFFQSFRILVELWFWHGYKTEVFPKLMSFEGANHDIYAGILAIVAGTIIWKLPSLTRITGIIYNIAGFLLLLNTLKAAATSVPSSIQQYPWDERFLQLGMFPFVYLPAILVPLALGFHILSLRQIFMQKKISTQAVAA